MPSKPGPSGQCGSRRTRGRLRGTLRGRSIGTAAAAAAIATTVLVGCERTREPDVQMAVVDSVLVELGGVPTGALGRTQRWRLISSIGSGLPPVGFAREDLPDPDSRSAGLLEVYCEACHWLPSPQMHSAAEWPLLLRRMLLRGEQVGERLGGPLTAELVGSEQVLRGMGWTLRPSPEDADSLLAYLRAHALPTALPGELGEGTEARFFEERCGTCHETPSPRAHTLAEWENEVIPRMITIMPLMGVDRLTKEEITRIEAFLSARAAPPDSP